MSRSAAAAQMRHPHISPMAQKKIVIVDDDRDTREVLQLALEEAGYQVGQASSALKLLSTLHVDRPDLILLDVRMSWMDGYEVCGALKRNPALSAIPVVFVTGRHGVEDERRGYACGASGYLRKPVDLGVLLEQVQRLIGRA